MLLLWAGIWRLRARCASWVAVGGRRLSECIFGLFMGRFYVPSCMSRRVELDCRGLRRYDLS